MPEEVRSTVINIYRIPLNILVMATLFVVGSIDDLTVFKLCTFCALVAIFAQRMLTPLKTTIVLPLPPAPDSRA